MQEERREQRTRRGAFQKWVDVDGGLDNDGWDDGVVGGEDTEATEGQAGPSSKTRCQGRRYFLVSSASPP